ncbi:alpha-amylase [Prauserella isguenensis]|uniref:Alpha-amylase n=1 Tax=Prauserella isguenensis TaxID=1470180 RepID=A0A839S8M5_9PSEU|nr:alpha-amylase [Prauserella isguenensis]
MRSRLPAILSTVLLTAGLTAGTAGPAAAAPPGDPDEDVIANLFQWNWDSVAAECTNNLGPNGFGGVQVSPPAESASVENHPWWDVYQPVSYDLTSRLGDRADFAAMVEACETAGVDVYVDAVINHMTGQDSGGTGYGGTTFPDKYTYDGRYSTGDFHHYPDDCPNPSGEVENYDDLAEVQNCELLGLADLDTGDEYVRDEIASYLNDLISMGVDGFRIDAAKHIPAADIAAIESRLNGDPYVYQEVIPGGAVDLDDYRRNGDLLEFTYGRKLAEQFRGNISDLETFGESWGMQPSADSVAFVDNHDTERDGSTLSYKDGRTYLLANIFSLAWDHGTPQVFSGFTFSGRDQAPPSNADGTVTDVDCGDEAWTCTTHDPAILGMVGWHNAVKGTQVQNWWSDGANLIAFNRGDKGFVTINNSDEEVTRWFDTGLPAGTYCDDVHDGCRRYTVNADGWTRITLEAKDAVAFHR